MEMFKKMPMKSYVKPIAAGVLLLLSAGLLFAQQAGGGDPRNPANPTPATYASDLFPLRRGDWRRYEIRRKGVKVGNLEIRVTSERRRKLSQYQHIDYFRLEYKDSYLRRTYRRMLARTPDIFIQNPRDGRYYPFIKTTMEVGYRFNDMLVVDVSLKPFKGRKRLAATLKHLKKDREEVYMQSIGLYSMRQGDMSYQLIDLPW